MTMKEKLLMLWLFVVVIVAFVLTHTASHLVWVVQNCFALLFTMLRS